MVYQHGSPFYDEDKDCLLYTSCPVKRLLDEGINLAIGTDGPAGNNCLDMFREMFLVTGLAKLRERDASCMPADEVLYMATAGGAYAMGQMCIRDRCDRTSYFQKK